MKLNYFSFKELNGKMLLTNDIGRYVFLDISDFQSLMTGTLDPETKLGKKLLDAGMIYRETDLPILSSVFP